MSDFHTLCQQLVIVFNGIGSGNFQNNPPIFTLKLGQVFPTTVKLHPADDSAYAPIIIHLLSFLSSTPQEDAKLETLLQKKCTGQIKWEKTALDDGNWVYCLTTLSQPDFASLKLAVIKLRLNHQKLKRQFQTTHCQPKTN